MGVPQVQIANLRTLDAGDAKKVPRGNREGTGLTRRNQHFGGLVPAASGGMIGRKIRGGQAVDRIADHRRNGRAGGGISRGGMCGGSVFHNRKSGGFSTPPQGFRPWARPCYAGNRADSHPPPEPRRRPHSAIARPPCLAANGTSGSRSCPGVRPMRIPRPPAAVPKAATASEIPLGVGRFTPPGRPSAF